MILASLNYRARIVIDIDSHNIVMGKRILLIQGMLVLSFKRS